ncbi:MAG: hypothetical protein D6722_25055 [Bacteroidetes bacterium]|nr:MAG: hypothetical protein D6722_25055 [Bacteroidota bacterium]
MAFLPKSFVEEFVVDLERRIREQSVGAPDEGCSCSVARESFQEMLEVLDMLEKLRSILSSSTRSRRRRDELSRIAGVLFRCRERLEALDE